MVDFLQKKIYDKKFRAILYQVTLAVLLVLLFWFIFQNTLSAVRSRGISTGFSFFSQPAGFSIAQSLIEYNPALSYGRAFLVGLLNTILVAAIGILLATILGFVIGIARLSKNFLIAKLAASYVEIFRNIPVLLQIFFWYHAVLKPLPGPRTLYQKGDIIAFSINNRGIYLPKLVPEAGASYFFISVLVALIVMFAIRSYARKLKEKTGKEIAVFKLSLLSLFGLPLCVFVLLSLFYGNIPFSTSVAEMGKYELTGGFIIIPEFISLLCALVIYTASFIAEIVRSGIQAINYGQTEASYSVGLSKGKTIKLILVPQALKIIIPPLISQHLNLIKNSSLAAAIAYPDIVSVFAGTVLNQTGQALEIIGITMGIYLLLSILTSLFLNWYNAQKILRER